MALRGRLTHRFYGWIPAYSRFVIIFIFKTFSLESYLNYKKQEFTRTMVESFYAWSGKIFCERWSFYMLNVEFFPVDNFSLPVFESRVARY